MSKKYCYLFTEGNANMRELLGGKGANLAEMTNIGLPVPQGFTITTEACTQYYEDGREINEEIRAQIMEYLGKMEQIVGKIFEAVRQKPELAGKLNMFMTYYLPTTTKLMDAYVEMDRQPVQGENIMKAKREISNSLSTINDAFEKLLDSFFREQAMDVSSDINVMKMMMKQEGLTEDDLTVLCGDLSWGMSLEETAPDFRFVDALPGKKLILKGNHDYWWTTAAKTKRFFAQEGIESIEILHNNAFFYGDYAVCGTRGWFYEEEKGGEHDAKSCGGKSCAWKPR